MSSDDISHISVISSDPAMDGLNHYAYANCNPIMYCDPTGFAAEGTQGGDDSCGENWGGVCSDLNWGSETFDSSKEYSDEIRDVYMSLGFLSSRDAINNGYFTDKNGNAIPNSVISSYYDGKGNWNGKGSLDGVTLHEKGFNPAGTIENVGSSKSENKASSVEPSITYEMGGDDNDRLCDLGKKKPPEDNTIKMFGVLFMRFGEVAGVNSHENVLTGKVYVGDEYQEILDEFSIWFELNAIALLAGAYTNAGTEAKTLSKGEIKAIKSYEDLITEHLEKIQMYKNNPNLFDNKGFLKNAPTNEIRQKIIQSRIKHLNDEIKTFYNNINKIIGGK